MPLVRRDPSKEMEPLTQLLADFDAGRVGGRRVIDAVRRLRNRRHESTEGKFEIDQAVAAAVRSLESLDRTALHPPRPQGDVT